MAKTRKRTREVGFYMRVATQDLVVLAVCIGKPEARADKKSKTGINKRPTGETVSIGLEGLADDAVCNRKYHGGPEQAVYVEWNLTRLWWQKTLNRPINYGLFGENLCIAGLDNQIVSVGDRFLSGDLVMEVTAPRMPCRVLGDRMGDMPFSNYTKKLLDQAFTAVLFIPATSPQERSCGTYRMPDNASRCRKWQDTMARGRARS